jgi:hypothetical protein
MSFHSLVGFAVVVLISTEKRQEGRSIERMSGDFDSREKYLKYRREICKQLFMTTVSPATLTPPLPFSNLHAWQRKLRQKL